MTDQLFTAIKAAGAVVGGSVAYLIAQVQLPDLSTAGNFGLVAFLAVLIGRYTFRQLEEYRTDLKASRSREDELHARIEALETDLHKLGKAKASADQRSRDLEVYAHRLRLFIIAAGATDAEIPPIPETSS